MQTRIIIHKAYNKSELVGALAEVSGRLIGFPPCSVEDDHHVRMMTERSATSWAAIGFHLTPSLKGWKNRMRKRRRAHRFERVTLLGDTRHFSGK